jgi:hypothetical protein
MNLTTKMLTKTAAAFCVLMSATTYVHSAVTITFQESGSDVVATSSGTINTGACSSLINGYASASSGVAPSSPSMGFGATGSSQTLCVTNLTPSSQFGSGSFTSSSTNSGASFFINSSQFWGPNSFTSSTSFSGSMTFANRTLVGMGLTLGNYTFTFANGSTSDTLTVRVIQPTPAPTIASVSPNTGSTAGGTAITITGTDLTDAAAITVGGAACTTFNVASATSATCTTPAGTAGTASVLVTTSGGTNAANTLFTYETPVAAPIPTLSEWAMIFLASLMGMFAFARIRRQS